MAMRMAMVRSALASTAARSPSPVASVPKRNFASSSHDDAHETAKWEKITYLGIAACTVLSFYNLSMGHPHHEEPPAYSYLHIRNKEFPWGVCSCQAQMVYLRESTIEKLNREVTFLLPLPLLVFSAMGFVNTLLKRIDSYPLFLLARFSRIICFPSASQRAGS